MSDKNTSSASGGIGFTGALTILFIGLKLAGVIDWSWWWVLSPIWVSIAIGLVVLIMLFVIIAVMKAITDYRFSKRYGKH